MKLSKHTISALLFKADVANESIDEDDPECTWAETECACRNVAAIGTTEALNASPLAQEELENYIGSDMPQSERRAIQADMCRAGVKGYDPVSENVTYSSRPKTLLVDGKRYVVG